MNPKEKLREDALLLNGDRTGDKGGVALEGKIPTPPKARKTKIKLSGSKGRKLGSEQRGRKRDARGYLPEKNVCGLRLQGAQG